MPPAHPVLGVCLHWLGGLAAASFYLPYRRVRHWAWETSWLVGGFFSWIVAPWALAFGLTRDLPGVLAHAPRATLLLTFGFGLLWGIGGLTFGLTMRYLGMSLGYGVALGICAVGGTLLPPLFHGQLGAIAATSPGQYTLAGVLVCALGIALAALAGLSKERELPDDAKRAAVREFNFRQGVAVALACGVLSACFAFGLEAAAPLAGLSAAAGTPVLWTGLPKLVVILLGGFTSNAAWCLWLNRRNGTGHQYFARTTAAAPAEPVPRLANVALCAAAGVTWYLQFFFYTMGETQMGAYGFSSWTLHMASIILFSTGWGLWLREWRGTGARTRGLLAAGIVTLLVSTLVVGYGNYLAAAAGRP